jgi:uncharacterized membrane protein HdeD (DUF308 family)
VNLHPKVRAAALAAVVVSILTVIGAVTDNLPDNQWARMVSGIIAAVIPVVAGYAKSSS